MIFVDFDLWAVAHNSVLGLSFEMLFIFSACFEDDGGIFDGLVDEFPDNLLDFRVLKCFEECCFCGGLVLVFGV